MKTFIDLFCGIGGFRVALEKNGLECVFSSDIDKNARAVYEKNFGDYPEGDITKIDCKDIPSFDILCAGFPCQPFSIAGRQKGLSDNRGNLFYEIIRIAKYHQPKVLLLENVKGLLYIDNGDILRLIISELENIGYNVYYSLLNSGHFGIPQNRERIYFVCIRKDLSNTLYYVPPKPTYEQICVEDILDKNYNKKDKFTRILNIEKYKKCIYKIRDKNHLLNKYSYDKLQIIYLGNFRVNVNKGYFSSHEWIYSIKGLCPTLHTADHPFFGIGKIIRGLNKIEKKRVMGYSDNHIIDDIKVHAIKQLGNSVIPKMIDIVFNSIKDTKPKFIYNTKYCASFNYISDNKGIENQLNLI